MKPNMKLSELLDAVRKNAELPDALSEATPPQVYSSPAFLELERDEIFNREWICVGRSDEFADPGRYRVTNIGRDSVIVLRDRDGVLRAMSNICRHRMMSLLEGEGTAEGRIVCPYHAWTYGLDGRLVGAAEMPADFDKRACRLPQFALEEWLGWVFVNLDADAEPLAPRLEPLSRRLTNYDLGTFVTQTRVDEVWNTNWKILFQNWMETYHLFATHPKTVEPIMPMKLTEALSGGVGYCAAKLARVPGVRYEYGEAMRNPNPKLTKDEVNSILLFGVFPTFLVSVSPERTFWMSLMPLGVDRVRAFWGLDAHPETEPEDQERVEAIRQNFDVINSEDKPIVEAIAANAKALAAEPGRLSHKEYAIWDFQRYLARMLTGPLEGDERRRESA